MTSMRRLNRQLQRWHRYARHTYWNPRVSRPAWMGPNTAMALGHVDAWNAREAERERRQCFRLYAPPCFDCGLPDWYDGDGDGIGSCDCPRCERCGAPPGGCYCSGGDQVWCEADGCGACDDPDCCGDPGPNVVTVTAFADQGLL
jgi:hypothetical protein